MEKKIKFIIPDKEGVSHFPVIDYKEKTTQILEILQGLSIRQANQILENVHDQITFQVLQFPYLPPED